MRLFTTLCIEITSECNRTCAFCPVAYNKRPDEQMPQALFEKAMMELSFIDYKGRIELYIYNEPIRDMPWLEKCLKIARGLVPKSCLMIASNGDYFKGTGQITRLFDLGLNQLLINCYSPGLFEKRQSLIAAAAYAANLEVGGPIYNRISPKRRTIQILDKSDPGNFGTGIFRLTNRAGNIARFMPETVAPLERMCVRPFRLLNINWEGVALLCCQDYHGHMGYGSLQESTLTQLWEHPVMNRYRVNLKLKDRTLPLCRTCDCHAGAYTHNVSQPTGPLATVEEIETIYRMNTP